MTGARLLIISGPYEGERLRRAAEARGLTTEVRPSIEALESDRAAAAPDMVLLTTSLVAPTQAGALGRLRTRFGAGVPLAVLGDPEAAAVAGREADVFFARPIGAEELMDRVRARLGGTPTGYATPTLPTLEPLRPNATAAGPPRIFDRLAASIDEALDEEMLAVARTVVDPRPGEAWAAAEFPAGGHTTRQAPQGLLESILGSVRPARPPGPSSGPPTVVRRGAGITSGEIAEADLPVLLGRAFGEALTGRLRVRRDGVDKAIFFETGRPVLATSNAVEDRMIEIFLRQGRITAAQHDRAVKVAAETGRRMGALLVDLGIMKSAELLPAVREHYEEIIFSLFGWTSGSWSFEPDVVADSRRIRLLRHPAALVAAGLRRAYPLARMKERLGSAKNVFVLEARGSGLDILAEATADAEETRIPPLFDGRRTCEEIVRASGAAEEAVYRVALTLWAFRLLVPSTGATAVAVPRPRDLAIERARLLARFTLVQEGDYFQILGVERRAETAEVRRAYERLDRELSPESVGPELGRELAEQLDAMRGVLAEAVRVLSDEGLRVRYRDALPQALPDDRQPPRPSAEPASGA